LFDELASASRQQDRATLLRLLAHAVPSYHNPDAVRAAPVEEQVQGKAQPLWGYATGPQYLPEPS
jgi:hypothetical protein